MRNIHCRNCGCHYDYAKEGMCPNCGAYNRPPMRETVDANGVVHHLDAVAEVTVMVNVMVNVMMDAMNVIGKRKRADRLLPVWTAPTRRGLSGFPISPRSMPSWRPFSR